MMSVGKQGMGICYPIATSRLQLTPFTSADEDALYVLESDPEVKRFTGGALTRAQTVQLLQSFIRQVEQTGLGAIAIKEKSSQQVVGLCGIVQELQEGEIFFGLARRVWGQGYATEVCRALLKASFQELALQRIIAIVHRENERSLRVVERIGMRLISKLASEEASSEELTYELVAQEWHPV